jgi:hypothetical protein
MNRWNARFENDPVRQRQPRGDQAPATLKRGNETMREHESDEMVRSENLKIIIRNTTPFHADKHKCPPKILVENLMIDFEHNDTATIAALADVMREFEAIIARLSETGGKLFDNDD